MDPRAGRKRKKPKTVKAPLSLGAKKPKLECQISDAALTSPSKSTNGIKGAVHKGRERRDASVKSSPVKSAETVTGKERKDALRSTAIKSAEIVKGKERKDASVKSAAIKSAEIVTVSESSVGEESATNDSSQPKTSGRGKRRNIMKPSGGSWLSHMGSVLVFRCVQSALSKSCDYRESIEDRKCEVDQVALTEEDLRLVWFLIKKEYEDKSLEDIEKVLRPFSTLSQDRFAREEHRLKFKDQMPKAPVTAFMMYSNEVSHKYKEKHPELTQREIAGKIGKKWKAMSADQQQKYRDRYLAQRDDYKEKMKTFFEEHPEAKPVKPHPRRDAAPKMDKFSPEQRKIQELKRLKPKTPTTSYMVFCKRKRSSMHKKYPLLSSREITVKLSELWKGMSEIKKAKYKKEYIDCQANYKEELKRFYEKYPEAKELLARKTRKTKANGKAEAAAAAVSVSTPQDSSSEEEEQEEVEDKGEDADESDEESDVEVDVGGPGRGMVGGAGVRMKEAAQDRVENSSEEESSESSDEEASNSSFSDTKF